MDLPQRLAGSTSDCKFIAMGGATEASIWSNYIEVKLPLPSNWQSIPYGRPLSGQSYRVMDFRRRDVPFWVEGELWIGGDGVGTYRGDEELVRQKFVEDSGTVWYRTGDKGRFWEDGTIEFLGREDFQVKIRGHRIELGEIETSIKSIDGIDESIVISNKGKLIAFFYSKGSEINDQKRFLIDNEEYITDELEKVLDDLGIIIIVDILIYEKCFIENGLYYTYNDLCKICKIDTHYKKLFAELCRGIITNNSKEQYKKIIYKYCKGKETGVILGCTEIGLLIQQNFMDVPIFDTTQIHAKKIAMYMIE